MTRVWTFPWAVLADDSADSMAELASRGVDGISLASHYHSVRTFDPKTPGCPQFRSFPGGCYFEPDRTAFDDVPIDPPVNELAGAGDPLGEVTAMAADVDLDVRAWTVLLHNSRLGAENPAYRVESAFGDEHPHSLCPSNPEVRDYFAAVVSSLSNYDVGAIDLESLGFPNAFHGHGANFGHSKNFAVTTQAGEQLLSQCFCEACQQRADGRFEISTARRRVQELANRAVESPDNGLPELSTLVREEPLLDRLFSFRASVVEDLLATIAEASGSVPLNYFVADGFGPEPEDGWPSGVVLDRVADQLDRVTALAYTGNPQKARARVGGLQSLFDGPVDVGVTLDPEVIDSQATFEAVASAAREAAEGELYVYNHALMTDEHLDWVAAIA